MLDLIWVMVDLPRCAIVGVDSLIRKFRFHRIYNLGDMQLLYFGVA